MVCFEYVHFVEWINEVIKIYITSYTYFVLYEELKTILLAVFKNIIPCYELKLSDVQRCLEYLVSLMVFPKCPF